MSDMSHSKEVESLHKYAGKGTLEDPFVVEFEKDDPLNPMNWSQLPKWLITSVVTLSVFAVTLTSSAYSVSSNEIMRDFNISTEVFTLGISLFVLGFAIGPAVWGPLVSYLVPCKPPYFRVVKADKMSIVLVSKATSKVIHNTCS